jgi:hypothetical protein
LLQLYLALEEVYMDWFSFARVVVGTGVSIALIVTAPFSARRLLRRNQPSYCRGAFVVASTGFSLLGIMVLSLTVLPMIGGQLALLAVFVIDILCGIAFPFLLVLSGSMCKE